MSEPINEDSPRVVEIVREFMSYRKKAGDANAIESLAIALVKEEAAYKADLAAVKELAKRAAATVRAIDAWNKDVQQIIGRVPEYQWGDLEALRAALAALPAHLKGEE